MYAYLVKNTWDNSNSKVKQEIVKYLGRSSKVTIKDIPKEFHKDPNIVAFIAAPFLGCEKDRRNGIFYEGANARSTHKL